MSYLCVRTIFTPYLCYTYTINQTIIKSTKIRKKFSKVRNRFSILDIQKMSIFQKSLLLSEKTLIFWTLTILVTTFSSDFPLMVTKILSHKGRSDRDRQRIVNKKHIFGFFEVRTTATIPYLVCFRWTDCGFYGQVLLATVLSTKKHIGLHPYFYQNVPWLRTTYDDVW